MIKRLRVTVDGNTYDVTVETADDPVAPAAAPPASVPSPALTQAPAAPVAPPTPAPLAPAPAGTASPGNVPSPLAGRVTAVIVAAGQAVNQGDHLLTLEAMKMNTFVFAPKAGKVTEIKTAVGDAVEEHQILMRIG
jgi:biotin carboxyl carrier protein